MTTKQQRLDHLAFPDPPPMTDAQRETLWTADFHASEALQREFRTLPKFLAFKKAESPGRVRIFASPSDTSSSASRNAQPIVLTTDMERWKHEWRTTPALRAEFGRESVYLAFRKEQQEGRVGPRMAATA